MDITIRRAQLSDAFAIETVRANTWKTAYHGLIPEDYLDSVVSNIPLRYKNIEKGMEKGESFFVARLDDTVIGFSVCIKCPDTAYHGFGEMRALYVLAEHQGKGIGRRLFEACKGEISDAGYDDFIVKCLKGGPAVPFYEKMGGKVIDEIAVNIGGLDTSELVFRFHIDSRYKYGRYFCGRTAEDVMSEYSDHKDEWKPRDKK